MALDDKSLERLKTCDERLQRLFIEVEKHWPLKIIEGHRGEAEQNAAFDAKKSKLRYPDGKHNAIPSMAVDASPIPIDWTNTERMIYFAGFVVGLARKMEIDIRWGGDWSGWHDPKKNTFKDLVHFEVKLGS